MSAKRRAETRAPEPGPPLLLADRIRAANEQLLLAGLRQLELAEESRAHARRIADLVTSQAAGVLVFDGVGTIVQANAPARQMLGLAAAPDLELAARLRELKLRRPDGSALVTGDHPVERLLGGERFSDLELRLLRADGEAAQLSFDGSAIKDGEDGGVSLAILVFHEVTAKRRLDELRSDYVALTAHDLRAPLTSILGYLELIRLVAPNDLTGRAAPWMDRIEEAARQMVLMVNDLVESTRLESGTLLLQKEPAFLRALILNVVAQLPFPEDRARVVLDTPGKPVRVSVDHGRIERVVMNLITNALKYSPPDAPVTVQLSEGGGEIILSVTDRGVGLSPESLSKLFQRFYRVDPGSHIEGMGLGLYIARLIVEAHGGRIWAESEPGIGSTFSVALPIE